MQSLPRDIFSELSEYLSPEDFASLSSASRGLRGNITPLLEALLQKIYQKYQPNQKILSTVYNITCPSQLTLRKGDTWQQVAKYGLMCSWPEPVMYQAIRDKLQRFSHFEGEYQIYHVRDEEYHEDYFFLARDLLEIIQLDDRGLFESTIVERVMEEFSVYMSDYGYCLLTEAIPLIEAELDYMLKTTSTHHYFKITPITITMSPHVQLQVITSP